MSHSQLTHSHTHTLAPCLFDSFFFPLLLPSRSFFFIFLRRPESWLPQHGWQCMYACVCACMTRYHRCNGATTQLRHSSKDSLHSFRVNKRHNCLRDSPYSERGFQCSSHPQQALDTSPPSCHCDASLPCVSLAVTPQGVW